MLFGRFGHIHIDFLRQENGAGKRTPVEFALEIVVFFDLSLIFARNYVLKLFGVIIIPALYALIYLSSVRDPGAHTGDLKAALVNLDQGVNYRGQDVNVGKAVVASIHEKHSFGFIAFPDEDEAKRAVRQGHMAFAPQSPVAAR